MARIFNIYFLYDDVLHNAIVSERNTGSFTEYILGNLDAELRLQLPGLSIISPSPGHLFFPGSSTDFSIPLMEAIIQSIVRHLHAGNDVSSKA